LLLEAFRVSGLQEVWDLKDVTKTALPERDVFFITSDGTVVDVEDFAVDIQII
jgi:hypothetical protein